MNRLSITLIAIVTVLSLVFVGCARAPGAPEAKTLRIGVDMALSGPAAGWGMPMERSVRMETEYINAEGGIEIGGEKYLIQVFSEDSGISPESAVRAGRKLIDRYKVHVIVGCVFDHQAVPLQEICRPAKIIGLGPQWGDVTMKKEVNSGYYFKTTPSPHEMQPALFTYAFSQYPEATRVATITDNAVSSLFDMAIAQQYVDAIGKELVTEEYYEPEVADFYPYLTRVLALEPDIVYSDAIPYQFGLIIKQAREMGYEGPIVYDLALSPEIIDIAGWENMEGVISFLHPVFGQYATPEILDYVDRYTDKYGVWDPGAVYVTYALQTLLQAYQIAGTIDDPDRVVEIMETTSFVAYGEEVRYGDGGGFYELPHQISMPFYVMEVKGGENIIARVVMADEQFSPDYWPVVPVYPRPK